MNVEKLGKMANEIAAFFAGEEDPGVALEGFCAHLRKFWDPRMRRELIAWVDGGGGEMLSALVRRGLSEGRGKILPPG